MKNFFVILILLVLISGCAQKATRSSGAETKKSAVPSEFAEKNVKEFEITAKKWSFDPAVITVKDGDGVKLIIKSTDVAHGFAISEYGINQVVNSNETAVIEFTADKKGEFNFFCNVPCGSGHKSMKGKLIVQ